MNRTYLYWKIGIAYLPFVAILPIELGSWLYGWLSHGERAAFCALCASVSHSATLLSGNQSEASRLADFGAKVFLLGGVLLSAYHWMLSQAPADDLVRYSLFGVAALLGGVFVMLNVVLAVRQRNLFSGRNGKSAVGGPESEHKEACDNGVRA